MLGVSLPSCPLSHLNPDVRLCPLVTRLSPLWPDADRTKRFPPVSSDLLVASNCWPWFPRGSPDGSSPGLSPTLLAHRAGCSFSAFSANSTTWAAPQASPWAPSPFLLSSGGLQHAPGSHTSCSVEALPLTSGAIRSGPSARRPRPHPHCLCCQPHRTPGLSVSQTVLPLPELAADRLLAHFPPS